VPGVGAARSPRQAEFLGDPMLNRRAIRAESALRTSDLLQLDLELGQLGEFTKIYVNSSTCYHFRS
jgi:hypothetical protein